jgi:LmbE family N-acetylglucosaminyl deacetylase
MPRSPVSNTLKRFLRSFLERRMRVPTDEELCEHTVVLAPHQDDETLGCGGTIARKRNLGARVRIIFMTDGSRSHEGFMSREELARLRAEEAVAACETLGVPRRDVSFLGIENGELEKPDQRERALSALMTILAADPPRQVFIPYHREPPPDHYVTTAIAIEALDRLEINASVWEYPIWFWHFWPFSWDRADSLRALARRYKQTVVRTGPMLRDLRTGVAIDHVIDVKRAALRTHATQTARRNGSPTWPILDDVCDGAFTELFFQSHELFHERRRAPLTASAGAAVQADEIPAVEVAI